MPNPGKSYVNPAYSRLLQSTDDYFSYTQANQSDDYFKTSMNNATEGKFQAVILSGLISGETAGLGAGKDYTQDIQRVQEGTNIRFKVKVRPINTTAGLALPDPCQPGLDPKTRMRLVEAHPWAISDFYESSDGARLFAWQLITCYYEEGTIGNSNFERIVRDS